MRRLVAVLTMGLAAGLIAISAGCGGQAAGSLPANTGVSDELAAAQGFDVGPLPEVAREVSYVDYIDGDFYSETSVSGISLSGPFNLVFEPLTTPIAWAQYTCSLTELDHLTGLELYALELTGEYWVGLANYAEDRWEWRGPFDRPETQELELPQPAGDYVSEGGTVAWVVVVEQGNYLKLSFSKVSADRITHIGVSGVGSVAVRISEPEEYRYSTGIVPVVVQLNAFLNDYEGFTVPLPVAELGMVQVSYLWPGTSDPRTGESSDGVFDHGGENCLLALRDVLKFTCGEISDIYGNAIDDLCGYTVATDNVGMYGFSHPGIAGVRVLAEHGADLQGVDYLVLGEMPTEPAIIAKEFGYYEGLTPVPNPYYEYPTDYDADALDHYVDPVHWAENPEYPEGRPYLQAMPEWFYMDDAVPIMWNKRYYSPQLTAELCANGQLDPADWPEDVANPLESLGAWVGRSTNGYNPIFANTWNYFDDMAANLPDLAVMLVFAEHDHVQPLADKPHIHQAFDGCCGNGLWTRLNPDRVYARLIDGDYDNPAFPDISANTGPMDWLLVEDGGYPNLFDGEETKTNMSLAAVSEMADRVQFGDWSANLSAPLL